MTPIELLPVGRIEDRTSQTYFEVTKDFVVVIDGRRETFHAGRDRLHDPSDELLRTHGQHFRAVTRGATRSASAVTDARRPKPRRKRTPSTPAASGSAASAAQRSPAATAPSWRLPARTPPASPPWRLSPRATPANPKLPAPIFGNNLSPYDVRLSDTADRSLRSLAWQTYHDTLEIGSMLLGTTEGSTIHILDAPGPGPRSKRRCHTFHPDACFDMAAEKDALRRSDGNVAQVGHWHTHPTGGDPSPDDLAYWSGLAELQWDKRKAPVFAGLIYRPAYGEARPTVRLAFVARRLMHSGGWIIEKAQVR